MQNRTFIIVFIGVVFILGALLYIYNPDPIEYENPRGEQSTTTPIFEDGTI